MIRHLIVAAWAVLLVGCDQRPAEQELVEVQSVKGGAEALLNARVVGYRFALPGEGNDEEAVDSGFSLLQEGGKIDLKLLQKLKKKEAPLDSDQVARLVGAVYGPHERRGPAACYDPHHIFLFFGDSNTLINAVEVCFSCTNLHAHPDVGESQWYRHDFRVLARLCDEIGIGMTSGTADNFIRVWDERDGL